MTRRRFLRYLGALPVVGPALLAVGARVAKALPAIKIHRLQSQFHHSPIEILHGWPLDLAATQGHSFAEAVDAAHKATIRKLLQSPRVLSVDSYDAEFSRQIEPLLEAFYRGRG